MEYDGNHIVLQTTIIHYIYNMDHCQSGIPRQANIDFTLVLTLLVVVYVSRELFGRVEK